MAWCEWNPFGQKVLRHHFPNAEGHGDITQTDFTIYRGRVDIITGGFPCQPYSTAGKRLGKEDERHLWPEMLRAIREIQPRWVVGENVLGLVNWSGGLVFHEVQADLEAEGYEVFPYVLPACAVNAPHRRDRVWFVAYANGDGHTSCGTSTIAKGSGGGNDGEPKEWRKQTQRINGLSGLSRATTYPDSIGQVSGHEQPFTDGQGHNIGGNSKSNVANTKSGGLEGYREHRDAIKLTGDIGAVCNSSGDCAHNERARTWEQFPQTEPAIRGGDDGLSSELDGITLSKWRNESIKAFGNAIVPQVALQIFNAINEFEASK